MLCCQRILTIHHQVRLVTLGAPRVGNRAFRDAFRALDPLDAQVGTHSHLVSPLRVAV